MPVLTRLFNLPMGLMTREVTSQLLAAPFYLRKNVSNSLPTIAAANTRFRAYHVPSRALDSSTGDPPKDRWPTDLICSLWVDWSSGSTEVVSGSKPTNFAKIISGKPSASPTLYSYLDAGKTNLLNEASASGWGPPLIGLYIAGGVVRSGPFCFATPILSHYPQLHIEWSLDHGFANDGDPSPYDVASSAIQSITSAGTSVKLTFASAVPFQVNSILEITGDHQYKGIHYVTSVGPGNAVVLNTQWTGSVSGSLGDALGALQRELNFGNGRRRQA